MTSFVTIFLLLSLIPSIICNNCNPSLDCISCIKQRCTFFIMKEGTRCAKIKPDFGVLIHINVLARCTLITRTTTTTTTTEGNWIKVNKYYSDINVGYFGERITTTSTEGYFPRIKVNKDHSRRNIGFSATEHWVKNDNLVTPKAELVWRRSTPVTGRKGKSLDMKMPNLSDTTTHVHNTYQSTESSGLAAFSKNVGLLDREVRVTTPSSADDVLVSPTMIFSMIHEKVVNVDTSTNPSPIVPHTVYATQGTEESKDMKVDPIALGKDEKQKAKQSLFSAMCDFGNEINEFKRVQRGKIRNDDELISSRRIKCLRMLEL